MICATSKYLHNVYNEHLPPLHIQLPHHAIASTPTCTRPRHTAGSAKTDSPGLLAPLAWRASQLAGGRAAGVPGGGTKHLSKVSFYFARRVEKASTEGKSLPQKLFGVLICYLPIMTLFSFC